MKCSRPSYLSLKNVSIVLSIFLITCRDISPDDVGVIMCDVKSISNELDVLNSVKDIDGTFVNNISLEQPLTVEAVVDDSLAVNEIITTEKEGILVSRQTQYWARQHTKAAQRRFDNEN